MYIKEVKYQKENTLELKKFIEMDYFAINEFGLSIELMMENAGLQLANLVANLFRKIKALKLALAKVTMVVVAW